jgi:hypothetical protein
MAREPLKNVGASVRARLLQRSRDERTDFQILLTRYALERLLYRLSRSEHRNRFILKGAMLFVTWVEAPFRPTRDLDLLGYGDNSPDAIGDTFRAILTQPVDDDGVVFDVDGLEAAPIREDLEYGGVRVRTQATIAAARIPIQVDVGFGDAITPGPIEIDYPALLDAPAPHLRLIRSRRWSPRSSMPLPSAASPFLTRERMAAEPEQLAIVVADLERFVLPLIEDADGDWRWKPGTGWIQGTSTA